MNLLKDWFQWKINTIAWTIRTNRRESKEGRIRSRTEREAEDNKRRREKFAATGTVTFYCLWWGHVWQKRCKSGVYRLVYRQFQKEEPQGRCVVIKWMRTTHPDLFLLGDQDSCKGERLMLKNILATVSYANCGVKWNRDKNAARNIRHISLHMSTNSDQRPVQVKRETYQAAYKLKPVTQKSKSNIRIEYTPFTAIIHFIPACFMNHSWKELNHQNLQLQSRQITTENSTWLRSIGSDRSITSLHTFTIPRERTSVRLCRPLLAQRITNYYGNAKEPKSLTHHRIFMDFDKFVQNSCLLAYDRTFCLQVCNNADCFSARSAVLIQLLLLKMCRWGAFQVVYISCTRSEELTHSLVLIALILRPKVATKKAMTILPRV